VTNENDDVYGNRLLADCLQLLIVSSCGSLMSSRLPASHYVCDIGSSVDID